jgi:hypothetical protein
MPDLGRIAKHNGTSRRVLEKGSFIVIGDEKYVNIGQKEVDEFILRLN